MTLGHKSISTTLIIHNNENPQKPYKVVVQADKNYAICDMSPRIGEVLSIFQGRQLCSTEGLNEPIISVLEDVLYVELNKKD